MSLTERSMSDSESLLKTPAVHHELLRGACSAIICGEEEDHLGELFRHDTPFDRLIVHRASLAFG